MPRSSPSSALAPVLRSSVAAATVALAWVLRQPAVVAPISGASKAHHLDDAVAAIDLELTDDEVARLEAPYPPRENSGFQ